MAEKYEKTRIRNTYVKTPPTIGEGNEMQSITVEHYEPEDKDAFLRFHGLESDRSAGKHERVDSLSYLEMMAKKNEKLETYKTAAEMMGLGTTNVVAGNYFPNYRPVVKIPIIVTGEAAAIMAHVMHGHTKEGDILKNASARSDDEAKPPIVRMS